MKPEPFRLSCRMISLHALNTVLTLPVSVAHVKWWYICGHVIAAIAKNVTTSKTTSSTTHRRDESTAPRHHTPTTHKHTFFSVSVYLDLNRLRMYALAASCTRVHSSEPSGAVARPAGRTSKHTNTQRAARVNIPTHTRDTCLIPNPAAVMCP